MTTAGWIFLVLSGKLNLLAAAFFTLCETLFAVDRTVPAGLEGNFALFLTIGAACLEHFSRPPAESTTTTLLKSHVASCLVLLKP